MSRGIQFLEQGHFISGFQQISSQSNQIQVLQDLITVINSKKQEILSQNTSMKIFVGIQESIKMLKDEIQEQRQRISQQILQSAQLQGQVIETSQILEQNQKQLLKSQELKIIFQLVYDCMIDIEKIVNSVKRHAQFVKLNQIQITQDYLSLREIIDLILNIESEKLIQLQNMGVTLVSTLKFSLQEQKQIIYTQILEPSFIVWISYLKKQMKFIGERLFQHQDVLITDKYHEQDELIRAVHSLNISVTDFSTQLINYFAQYADLKQSTNINSSNQQLQFFRPFFSEFLNYATQLGFKQKILDLLQQSWFSSQIFKLSLDKIQISSLLQQYQQIIGYIQISQQFPDILSQMQTQQLKTLLLDSMQNFCLQISKYQQVSPKMYADQSSSNPEIILHLMIKDIYMFRKFIQIIQQNDYIERIDLVDKSINQYWNYIFIKELCKQYNVKFQEMIKQNINSINFQVEDNQWIFSIEQYLSQFQKSSIDFQTNLLKLLMNFIDYILIWLDKGQYKTPFLEQVLLLDVYMPNQLSENNFYEILTAINEFYLTCIQTYFDEQFASTKSFSQQVQLFYTFNQLVPVFLNLNKYIQNSVYFDPASLFSSVIEIIYSKIQQYFDNIILTSIKQLVIYTIRSNKLPTSINLPIVLPQLQIQQFQHNPPFLQLIPKLLNFIVSLLQFVDVSDLTLKLPIYSSYLIIDALAYQKSKFINQKFYSAALQHFNQIQQIKISVETFKIDIFSLLKDQFSACSKTVQSVVSSIFGFKTKKKLSLQIETVTDLTDVEVQNYADFRIISNLIQPFKLVQLDIRQGANQRQINAMRAIEWALFGKEEPEKVEKWNELYECLVIAGFQSKKFMVKLIQ